MTTQTAKPAKSTMPKSFKIQGRTVDQRLITAYGKSLLKHDEILSVWANAATVQIAKHGNRDWMKALFELPSMTVKKGGLSKLGTELLNYIKAHCPRVVWNDADCRIAVTGLKPDGLLATHFVAHTAKCAEDIKVGDGEHVVQRGKFYTPIGSFNLTFTEFRNLDKPAPKGKDEDDTAPKVLAKAFITQTEKALNCVKDKRFIGTVEELASALAHAEAFAKALQAQIFEQEAKERTELVQREAAEQRKLAEAGIAATEGDKLDVGRVQMAVGVGTNRNGNTKGADTRAGDKVDAAAAREVGKKPVKAKATA